MKKFWINMMIPKIDRAYARPDFWIEFISVLIIILASFCIAVLFYKNIIPWGDEAQFIDPAINFAEGKGFVSSAWPYQNPDEFFLGNAPLYSFLSGVWFKVVGFGLLQARVLNYALVTFAAFLVWLTIYSSNFISNRTNRLAAIVLILCGYGVVFSYYSARYDALGMAIAAACYLCICSGLVKAKNLLLLVLGILVPLAGFHLVVAFVILLLIDFYNERKVRQDFIIVGAGIFLGLLLLMGLAAYHDLLKKFFLMTFGSQHTVSGRIGKALMTSGMSGAIQKFSHISFLNILQQDPSFLCTLFALLSGCYVFRRSGKTPLAKGEIIIAIGFVVIIPLSLSFIGKYPVYYSWIGYFPAILFTFRWMEKASAAGLIAYRNFVIALMMGAFTLGLPNILVRSMPSLLSKADSRNIDIAGDLKARIIDYNALDNRVKASLQHGDVVYSDPSTYFAARSIASQVFVSTYGRTKVVKDIPEHHSITALVIRRGELDELSKLIPGDWVEVGPDSTKLAKKSDSKIESNITIYRRKLEVLESLNVK
ncbi:MAG: hypothetical protein Q8S71_07120 [Hydrogenophaga sp.]|nr:hypothetical protein [Hydrogenophaga sp.]